MAPSPTERWIALAIVLGFLILCFHILVPGLRFPPGLADQLVEATKWLAARY